MEISALQRPVKAADLSLEQIAKSSQVSEKEKVQEVSRQFEAVLLRQILSHAQKPVFASTYTDNSLASGIYQDMMVEHLSDAISRSGDFGLARSLQSQLQRELKAADESPDNQDML